VLECPQKELQATNRVVRQVMENACPLSIPLTTDARWGANWDEMQAVD
jgi:DNA polymerase-1